MLLFILVGALQYNRFSMQDSFVLCVHIAYFFTRKCKPQTHSCFSVGIFPGFQLAIPYENAFTRELSYLSIRWLWKEICPRVQIEEPHYVSPWKGNTNSFCLVHCFSSRVLLVYIFVHSVSLLRIPCTWIQSIVIHGLFLFTIRLSLSWAVNLIIYSF